MRQLSTPVELVVGAAERFQTEAGDPSLDAVHLLAGFARRHAQMLEDFLGGIDVQRFIRERSAAGSPERPSSDAVLEDASARAEREGSESVQLRHLAAALADALGLSGPRPAEPPAPAAERSEPEQPVEPVRPVEPERPPAPAPAPPRPSKPTPTLDRLGRDLTALARADQLNRTIGREAEIDEVIEVLCRQGKRNPLLVGPAGVGKTAVVEGVAQRVAAGGVPPALHGVRIVELTTTSLLAESPGLPDLMNLVDAISEEASQPGIVLFIDEFQAAIEVGGRDLGIAGQLKPRLARGELACIGAMTEADFYRLVASDPSLERRFEPVRIHELSPEDTSRVLESVAAKLATEKGVDVPSEVLEAALRLSGRYLNNRYFPDKAIDVLDRAVARAHMQGAAPDVATVSGVVSDMTGLPLGTEAEELAARLEGLPDYLRSRVKGQDPVVDVLGKNLQLKVRGLDLRPERPNGVFLFTGPTGVGKTEMARALAEYLFGSSKRMVRLDMSEYSEAHYASKIVGSPPGYVGYEQGAPLLEEVSSRPFTVVLLDEIEKAHPQVHRLFLQVFDEGFLTSGAGRRVYFSDAVIIMTANINVERTRHQLGFAQDGDDDEAEPVLRSLDQHFPPEFVNRIDAICAFRPLARAEVKSIIQEVTLPGWLEQNRASGIDLVVSEEVLDTLAARGYSEELGARQLHRVVEDELLSRVSLVAPPGAACRLEAGLRGDEIVVERTG